MLTPEAFKICLLRAQRRPKQTVDPVVYCNYYLLLEKTYKMYTDYEKQLLARQITQKDQQIEQKDQQLEQQASELEDERQYRLGLQESLLANKSPLQPLQVIYIATSVNYAKQNRFKIGGVSSLDHLEGRLSTYNSRSASGDDFFYTDWFNVVCYRDVEKRLETLIGRFKDECRKEIYILHYTNLRYIVEYVVEHYNEETDVVNQELEKFIKNLNRRDLKPAVVKPKHLHSVQISRVGHPDVVISTDSTASLKDKMELFIKTLSVDTMKVNAKQVFDCLDIKSGRRLMYAILEEVLSRLLPNAKMVKF